jgi:hypothetical protein
MRVVIMIGPINSNSHGPDVFLTDKPTRLFRTSYGRRWHEDIKPEYLIYFKEDDTLYYSRRTIYVAIEGLYIMEEE